MRSFLVNISGFHHVEYGMVLIAHIHSGKCSRSEASEYTVEMQPPYSPYLYPNPLYSTTKGRINQDKMMLPDPVAQKCGGTEHTTRMEPAWDVRACSAARKRLRREVGERGRARHARRGERVPNHAPGASRTCASRIMQPVRRTEFGHPTSLWIWGFLIVQNRSVTLVRGRFIECLPEGVRAGLPDCQRGQSCSGRALASD